LKRKYIIISIIVHLFLIIFLIYFSWTPGKKPKEIQPIEMVNTQPPEPIKINSNKKKEPEARIPEPKEKDDIVVPKKKIIKKRKIIKKPEPKRIVKPLPKIKSSLEDKLKKLDSNIKEPEPKKEELQTQPTSKKKLLTQEDSIN